jgi:hypothetical protein
MPTLPQDPMEVARMTGRATSNRVHQYTGEAMLRDVWRDKDGNLYRTIALITDPAVVIEDVVSGKRQTHVIHSLNFSEFERLRPEEFQQ